MTDSGITGPVGVIPRPLAREIESVRITVFRAPVGPLGGPRPFAGRKEEE